MDALFEAGIVPTLYSNLREMLLHNAKETVAVYESLDDYIEEVSSRASPNVKLQNVYQGFLYITFLASWYSFRWWPLSTFFCSNNFLNNCEQSTESFLSDLLSLLSK